jgi:AraC family L-rhamnose operon transcriptional activator RhaR
MGAMADFRPLLLEQLDLSLPQVVVRRICVNQHLPETDWIRGHAHDFEQLIVYLNGAGAQNVGDVRHAVVSGTVVAVPRGIEHAFIRQGQRSRSPMCLVIDLEISARRVADELRQVTQLNASQMAEIRRSLVALAAEVDSGKPNPLRQGAAILEIAGIVLETAAALREATTNSVEGESRLALVQQTVVETDLAEWRPESLAAAVGIQRDVLNRSLRRECGLTLGQWLAAQRLELAKKQLSETDAEIQEIGAKVGFYDRNYFARWFRKQTGLSPTEWRRR